jgi:tRNA (guanine26-N2/guanine27-N2)-dimethyltransferase
MITSGPIWLGNTTSKNFVNKVKGHITEDMGMANGAQKIFSRLLEELDVPMHYDQHKLCRLWKLPASSMEIFVKHLSDAGFRASRTHYGGTTLKTNATVSEIYENVKNS